MNLEKIVKEIETTSDEHNQQPTGRREVFKSFGAKVALASLPLAIGSLFRKADAKTTDAVVDALNYSLKYEYMLYTFFRTATNTGGLIPSTDLPGFKSIEAHEKGHVNYLIGTINGLGGVPFKPNHYSDPTTQAPYVPAAYDFTAHLNTTYASNFYNVFTDYPTFLVIAQAFKDTIIRAYNAQLSTYVGTTLLTQLQQLSAAEGRHAAFIRLVRRNMGAPETPAPWITNNIPPHTTGEFFQPNYNGEENTGQMNMDIASLPGIGGTIPALSASAAFDEPIDLAFVTNFFLPFILT